MRVPAAVNVSEEGAVLKVKLTRLSGSKWLILIVKQKRGILRSTVRYAS